MGLKAFTLPFFYKKENVKNEHKGKITSSFVLFFYKRKGTCVKAFS